jgi:Mor family transcriptional regulator
MDDKKRLGESNGQSKLTEAKVRQIRYRAKNGATHRELAEDYRVCEATIWLILSRRTWAHV